MTDITIFSLEGWTNDLDRKVLGYLEHTGSLSCVCKASQRECLAVNAGRLCCPAQQYYHPEDAGLVSIFYVDEDLDPTTPRFTLNYGRHTTPPEDTSHSYNYWKWSCCGKNIGCTGCEAVCDADEGEDVYAAIRANQQARQQRLESWDQRPEWTKMLSEGDPDAVCFCGYLDGSKPRCECGQNSNDDTD